MAKRGKKKSAPDESNRGPVQKKADDAQQSSQVPHEKSASQKSQLAGAAPIAGWKWPIIFAFAVAGVASVSIWMKAGGGDEASPDGVALVESSALAKAPDFPANTGEAAGYTGSASCAECHSGIVDDYNHIAMGRSLYPPTPDNIIEDYETDNEFFHERSNMYFRMTHEGDKFFQTSFQKDPDGNVINEKKVEISYVVGSGNHSRSYIHREPDGKTYQLPVAWYTQEDKWAMNPGYDNAGHINFSRRITYDCLFCHAAYPELEPGADQSNYGESSFFPEHLEAIDCERCHGPAQEHVNLARNGAAIEAIRESIVNTGNLSNELQLELCMQCHLETTSGNLPHSVHTVGKGIYGYRPGEPLEEYRYAFNHPPGTGHDDKFEIAGQAYRLRMSECFIQSEGRMTCTTCHDPHRVPTDRISAAIQSCLECHSPKDCMETMELRLPVQDNCIQCHMPQRRTDDVVHVVMTDHYIQRRPPSAEELLAPKEEHGGPYRGDIVAYYPEEFAEDKRDLYMGLAYVANSANLEKGITYLDTALQNTPGTFAAVYTKGVALKMLGKLEQARDGLEGSVKLRPDHPQAWMALGDLYEQMRNYGRSIECYRMAARLDPRLSRAQNGLGTSLMLSGDMAGAEKAFRAAIVLDPFDDNAHLNLSGIYLQQSKYEAAEAEARAALAVNPNRPAGWGHLAQCAIGRGKPLEAIFPALESVVLDEHELQSGEVLMVACKSAGVQAALPLLEKSRERAPFASLVATAYCNLQLGDVAAAGAALDDAADETTRASVLALAANTALESSRPNLALGWSSEAATAMPDNPEATVVYAGALRASGQAATAAQVLQTALGSAQDVRVLNALAWLRATAQEDALRNGAEASQLVDNAIQMMGGQANIFLLQTQAATAAENGDFSRAQGLAGQALEMGKNAGLGVEVRKVEAQLAAYNAGKAYRSSW